MLLTYVPAHYLAKVISTNGAKILNSTIDSSIRTIIAKQKIYNNGNFVSQEGRLGVWTLLLSFDLARNARSAGPISQIVLQGLALHKSIVIAYISCLG